VNSMEQRTRVENIHSGNNLVVVEVVGSGGQQRAGQVRHQQALQHRMVEGEDQQKDDSTIRGELMRMLHFLLSFFDVLQTEHVGFG
jgi:hypothetical protein